MGNIMHLSFPEPVENKQIRDEIQSILTDYFGNGIRVTDGPCWNFDFRKDIQKAIEKHPGRSFYGYDICRIDESTLSHKVQTHPFTQWLSKLIQHELTDKWDGEIVDYDGSGEVWDSHPEDFQTYEDFLEYMYGERAYPFLDNGAIERRKRQRKQSVPNILLNLAVQ